MADELSGPPPGQYPPSDREAVATARPAPPRGHLARYVLLISGVLVLLVVLVGAFMVMSQAATSDRVKASHAAIDRLRADHLALAVRANTALAGLGGSIDVASSLADYTKESTDLDALKITNSADLAVIDQANAKVQDRSILTLLGGAQLDAEDRRLHSYREAILIEQGAIENLKQLLALNNDFEAALAQWQPLLADLNASNLAAAEKDYPLPSRSLDRVIAEANTAMGTPGKFKEFLALSRTHLNDINALLVALRVQSQEKADVAGAALDRDIAAEKAFDTPGLQQQTQDLAKQVFEKMDAALKKGD